MTDPYENLVTAVVQQTVSDWRAAVRKLRKRPNNYRAKRRRAECEAFFRSEWFTALTGANGSYILRTLKKEEGIYDE